MYRFLGECDSDHEFTVSILDEDADVLPDDPRKYRGNRHPYHCPDCGHEVQAYITNYKGEI